MKSSSRARKIRTRIRRPKYLSLRLQLSPTTTDEEIQGMSVPDDNMKLIDMLPLKRTIGSRSRNIPNSSIEVEKLDHDQSNMAARLFTNMDGCSAAAVTLTDILQNKGRPLGSSMQGEMVVETEEERGSTVSSCWASSGGGTSSAGSIRRGSLLERAALRSSVRREDDDEEEEMKWVRISEVVREEGVKSGGYCRDQEEVSSCIDRDGMMRVSEGKEMKWKWWWPERISEMREEKSGKMLLKLDYSEVMNAWGDRGGGGPFCWDFDDGSGGGDQDSPQTVPDLQLQQRQSVQSMVAGSVWAVPVDDQHVINTISGGNQDSINGELLESVAAQGTTTTKALREASILRYKEKRMNRLFSKRIRYEVRKLNAEKRPRIKGRFVKRD